MTDYVTRSLVRAAAFRVMRKAPLWLAILVLGAGWLLEHAHGAERRVMQEETCTGYTSSSGTHYETCRQPGGRERNCTTYVSPSGTSHTECHW